MYNPSIQIMRQDYLQQIQYNNPWAFGNDKYSLILSNDLDSLLSCALLQQLQGHKINYFYDFSGLYSNKGEFNAEESVGVDIALADEIKSFDNHVVLLDKNDYYNSKCVNLNLIDKITPNNYGYKFCGSTLIQLYSIYNIPLPSTDEGKMILLAIDSTFLGFYHNYNLFKERNIYYLRDVLGFEELVELEEKYKKNNFEDIIKEFNLKTKLFVNQNGKLYATEKIYKDIFELLGIQKPKIKNSFTLIPDFRRNKRKNRRIAWNTSISAILKCPFFQVYCQIQFCA